ncbi:hypothetical protein ACSBR1_020684 [Camellia fascicularis]
MQELHALCAVTFVVIEVVLKRSGETVSRYFNDILKIVLRLQANLLVTPNPITEASTDPRWNCFQNCLGALDDTYIKVHVPVVHQARYRTRK